jgi:hypothetical protein
MDNNIIGNMRLIIITLYISPLWIHSGSSGYHGRTTSPHGFLYAARQYSGRDSIWLKVGVSVIIVLKFMGVFFIPESPFSG